MFNIRVSANADCSLKDLKYRETETFSCFHGLTALQHSRVNRGITPTAPHYQSEILFPSSCINCVENKFPKKSLSSYKVSKNAGAFFPTYV